MSLVGISGQNGKVEPSAFQSPTVKDDVKGLKPQSSPPKSPKLTKPSRQLAGEELESEETDKVGQKVFGGWRQFYNDTTEMMKKKGVQFAASTVEKLGKWYQTEDEPFLRELTGSSEVIDLVEKIAPWAPSALENIFPDVLNQLASEKKETVENVAKSLFIHLLANLAQGLYPKQAVDYYGDKRKIQEIEKVTLESLLERAAWHLITIIAEEIDSIDAATCNGVKPDIKQFGPLANKLIEQLLPHNQQKLGAKISCWTETFLAGCFYNNLTKYLFETYLSATGLFEKSSKNLFFIFKDGEPAEAQAQVNQEKSEEPVETPSASNETNEMVKNFALYLAKCMSEGLKNGDEALLTKLTGAQDLQALIKISAPLLSKFISKEGKVSPLVEAFLLNIISNIGQEIFQSELEKGITLPVDQVILKTFLHLFKLIQETFQKAQQTHRYSIEVGPDLFLPLAERLLKTFLPKNHLITGFFERRKHAILNPISSLLYEIYQSSFRDQEDCENRLRDLWWDAAKIEAKQRPQGKLPSKPTKELSQSFGLEEFIDQLFRITRHLSKQATGSIIDFFSDEKTLIRLMRPFFSRYGLSDKLLQKMAKGISFTLCSKEPSYIFIKEWFQNTFNLTLAKAMTHFFEKVPPEYRSSKKRFFAAAIQLFLETGGKHLPQVYEKMETAIKNSVEKEYFNKGFYQDLDPLINELIYLFFEDQPGKGKKTLPDHFFGPRDLRLLFDKCVRKLLLPLALGPIFTQTMRWMHKLEASRKTMKNYYKSNEVNEACRVIGALTKASIPFSFQEKRVKITESLLPYLVEKPEKAAKIKKIVDKTLLHIANNNSKPMQKLLGFVELFAEASISYFFAKFTVYLNSLETASKEDPKGPLLIHGTIKLLDELKEHFRLIGEVRAKRKSSPKELEEMLIALHREGRLHSALTPLLGNAAVKDSKWEFFLNLSKDIFGMLGTDEVPAFLKAFVWNAFEEKLAPEILETLFIHLKDPHTINLLIAFIFQEINRNALSDPKSKEEDNPYIFNDKLQAELEKTAGELIPALVKMHRSGISPWLLKIPAILKLVQRVAGNGIGQSMRRKLNDTTAIELIKQMVISILPKLHPGEWSKEGKFIAHKVLKNGSTVPINELDFSHLLPRTKEEKKIYEKRVAREKKEAEREVVKQITQTLSYQTRYIFVGFLKKISDKIEAWLSKILKFLFGNQGLKLKKAVGKILKFVTKHLIKPLLTLIFYPVILATGKLMKASTTKRTKDIHLGVHSNIFYRLIDTIMILISDGNQGNNKLQTGAV